MVEHRITETETPAGSHTTIVTEEPRRGGGSTLLIVLVLVIAAAVAIWAFSGIGGAEVAKDNAVADAAQQVGAAASEVGDAAREVTGN